MNESIHGKVEAAPSKHISEYFFKKSNEINFIVPLIDFVDYALIQFSVTFKKRFNLVANIYFLTKRCINHYSFRISTRGSQHQL